MTSPAVPPQPQEQISYEDILAGYRLQLAELTHQLIVMECRLKNRNDQIESLLAQRDQRGQQQKPHQ